MLKKISITLGAFFAITIGMGIVMSDQYNVQRSITINATPAEIHQIVGDLTKWSDWTPWQQTDPDAQIEIGDISQGAGATQKWVGKSSGQLKITKASEDYGIDYDLSFNGDKAITKSSITYEAAGDKTNVSWRMIGQMSVPVIGSYVAMIMDSMAGPTLEMGLGKLKDVIESETPNS